MSVAYYKSTIGTLIIEADEEHINAILFANSYKGKKIDEENLDYSYVEDSLIGNCIMQLNEYFIGSRKDFDLPVKQQGTDFQQTVWNNLLDIPYGKMISYLDLSKKIGNPKAIRAVGQTNGNNQVCIVVPCHRVIGSNGELTGYGGDLWRKKWLLEHEGAFGKTLKLF